MIIDVIESVFDWLEVYILIDPFACSDVLNNKLDLSWLWSLQYFLFYNNIQNSNCHLMATNWNYSLTIFQGSNFSGSLINLNVGLTA